MCWRREDVYVKLKIASLSFYQTNFKMGKKQVEAQGENERSCIK